VRLKRSITKGTLEEISMNIFFLPSNQMKRNPCVKNIRDQSNVVSEIATKEPINNILKFGNYH
jgi:hypothetical protein